MINILERGVRKVWARITLLSLELVFVLVAFFGALAGFIVVARMIFLKHKEELDSKIFGYVSNHVSKGNTDKMEVLSFLGSHYFLIPANLLLVLYFLFVRKERWYSIKVPVIAITSLVLMMVLKQFFHRDRPLVPLLQAAKGLSFPSGHSMMSATFYGLLIYLTWKNFPNNMWRWIITVALLLLILFIGLSRIYLRVHYPTDVIAGFCLGFVWLVVSLAVLNKVERLSKKHVTNLIQVDASSVKAEGTP